MCWGSNAFQSTVGYFNLVSIAFDSELDLLPGINMDPYCIGINNGASDIGLDPQKAIEFEWGGAVVIIENQRNWGPVSGNKWEQLGRRSSLFLSKEISEVELYSPVICAEAEIDGRGVREGIIIDKCVSAAWIILSRLPMHFLVNGSRVKFSEHYRHLPTSLLALLHPMPIGTSLGLLTTYSGSWLKPFDASCAGVAGWRHAAGAR